MTREQAYKKAVKELFEICEAIIFDFNDPRAGEDLEKCRKQLLDDLMAVKQ